uniref:Uncharacterized protein n=1 Tax=Geospiza parvula TaxID=87175 RepID=A0A8C3MPS2_GEOPR
MKKSQYWLHDCNGRRYGEVTVILLLFAPQINSVHCHCGSDLLLSSFHAIIQHFKEPF